MKKLYKNVEERFAELDQEHNAGVPTIIKLFWGAIENHSDKSNELGGEGNSGEFHDAKEEKRLIRELKEAEERLVSVFAEYTGWKPVKIEFTRYEDQQVPIESPKKPGTLAGYDNIAYFWKFEKV